MYDTREVHEGEEPEPALFMGRCGDHRFAHEAAEKGKPEMDMAPTI